METVCLSSKYGYCKFRNNCDKIHYKEICEIKECSGYKCYNRHPRECFFFRKYGRCKFGSFCAYKHSASKQSTMEEEMKVLKVEMITLKENFENLKAEMAVMKNEREEQIVVSATNETQELEIEVDENVKIQTKTSEIILETVELESENKIENTKEEPKKIENEETLEQIMEGQTLESIIRENSGLYCELCSWGPAKTKKGVITHKRKKHSNFL